MPAASYSSSVSWGLYFAASLVLVVVCAPALAGVRNYAYGDAVARTSEGIARIFSALGPGVTVTFSFHPAAPDERVELAGRSVTVFWGAESSTYRTLWPVPNQTLEPDVRYALSVVGGQVEVFELV